MTGPTLRTSPAELRRSPETHPWLHFPPQSAARGEGLPIIVSGDGCYVTDVDGKRYLDGLAGLFAVQIGYSYGEEVGKEAGAQMPQLPFFTNWSYAHPRAIELAEEVATLAPG